MAETFNLRRLSTADVRYFPYSAALCLLFFVYHVQGNRLIDPKSPCFFFFFKSHDTVTTLSPSEQHSCMPSHNFTVWLIQDSPITAQ